MHGSGTFLPLRRAVRVSGLGKQVSGTPILYDSESLVVVGMPFLRGARIKFSERGFDIAFPVGVVSLPSRGASVRPRGRHRGARARREGSGVPQLRRQGIGARRFGRSSFEVRRMRRRLQREQQVCR